MNNHSFISPKNIELLESICINLNRYIPLVYLALGMIGNILNIITFTRRPLRANPCTVFLLYSSIANIFHLTFGLVTRIVTDQFHLDIEGLSLPFCKLKYYIMYVSASLSLYFVLLASINRYNQSKSSSHRRYFSQLISAHRLSLIITLIICMIYIHILVLFRIEQTATSSGRFGLTCYALQGFYRIFLDFFLVITWSLLPPCLMFLFGLLTIRYLRRTKTRAFVTGSGDSIAHQQRKSRRKADTQLVFMLLLQILVIFCSTLPFGLQKIIATLAPAQTSYQLAVEHFVLCVTRQISFTNSTFCFVFYILAAEKFRSELIHWIQQSFSWIHREKNLREQDRF